jgi:hypothetical protein
MNVHRSKDTATDGHGVRAGTNPQYPTHHRDRRLT